MNIGFDLEAKNLVRALLTPDITNRLKDAKTIKSHAWFADVNWTAVGERKCVPPYIPSIDVGHVGSATYFDEFEDLDQNAKHGIIDETLFDNF